MFDCQLLFNTSDPYWVVTHDKGVVQSDIKFYFPWSKKRQLDKNYLTDAHQTLATERGIKYLIIDATQNKGTHSAHVIILLILIISIDNARAIMLYGILGRFLCFQRLLRSNNMDYGIATVTVNL